MGRYQGTSGAAWAASGRVRRPRGPPCGIPGVGKGLTGLFSSLCPQTRTTPENGAHKRRAAARRGPHPQGSPSLVRCLQLWESREAPGDGGGGWPEAQGDTAGRPGPWTAAVLRSVLTALSTFCRGKVPSTIYSYYEPLSGMPWPDPCRVSGSLRVWQLSLLVLSVELDRSEYVLKSVPDRLAAFMHKQASCKGCLHQST